MENTASLFERGTRAHLRFDTNVGFITVEDLWDMPLTNPREGYPSLDVVAKNLHRTLKETDEVSFVDATATDKATEKLQLAFDIVKHVIDVRKAERDEAKNVADKKLQKQKLLGVLARKQDAALEQSSEAEIKAMIEAL